MLTRLIIVTLIGISSAYAQPMRGRVDVPVMAGGEPDMDACPSGGTVVGLNPRGDGFLSVRSGPGGSQFREIDRVYNGMRLAICDQVGPWYAVVLFDRQSHRLQCFHAVAAATILHRTLSLWVGPLAASG